jgi:hypothetical protein
VTRVTAAHLQALAQFDVAARFDKSETRYTITVAHEAAAVGVLRQAFDSDPRRRGPFTLYTGPGHAIVAGYIAGLAPVTAFDPEQHELGSVGFPGKMPDHNRWQIEQPGWPLLTGKPAGVSAIRYNSLVDDLTELLGGSFLPFTFAFKGPGTPGLIISRPLGTRERFHVEVRDGRLDRRIALAAVVALSLWESQSLKRTVRGIG